MKTFAPAFALATFLSLFGTSTANAQMSLGDYYNDYELYVADYETKWFTIVTWTDGTTSEYRSSSQQGAEDFAVWLYLHISTVKHIDIVDREELGDWIYIDTFGTYYAASIEASFWGANGYETDIRSIRVNDIYSTPYTPIRSTFTYTK